jgi:hypothetical protein
MAPADRVWFEDRPRRTHPCPRCRGCGTIVEAYALAYWDDPLDGAPADALRAVVVGSFDISTSCRAFEFNGQIVVVCGNDDPDQVARTWWLRQYGETPEASFSRR